MKNKTQWRTLTDSCFWGLDHANYHLKPGDLCISRKEYVVWNTGGIWDLFFFFNWTDEGLCWPLSVRCRQRDFVRGPVFHPQEKNCIITCSSSIYPWGVCLSKMPTKPWVKLRNLEETCKLKLAQSHLLLLFIYLGWDDSHIHLPYGIKSFGSWSYYYMIQRV